MGRLFLAPIAGIAIVLTAPPALSARLNVQSTPPGGSVFLDDRYLGVTPLSVEIDGKGRHLLRIEKRGHAPWRSVVELGGEPATVRAELEAEALGRITIVTNPAGADVYIDGRPLGRSPLEVADLAFEYHTVQLTKDGHLPAVEHVALSRDQPTAEVSVTLTARLADYLIAHVEAHPEDVMALADLAHEYSLQHRFDECLAALGKGFDAVAEYGESLDQDAIRRLYQEVDRLHQKQFDYAPDDVVESLQPRLIEALRAGLERGPKNGYTYECLGQLLTQQGDTEGALATYQAGAAKTEALPVRIRLLGRAGSVLYSLGQQAEKAKEWERAADAYEKVVETYPELWCAANALGRLCYVYGDGLSDPKKAFDAARRLVDGFPKDPNGAMALSRAAGHLSAAGEIEQAAALYEEIADRYPTTARVRIALIKAASLYERTLKQPDRAVTALRKLIEISGRSPQGADARRRAATLLRAQGDEAGANALVAEILSDFPLSREAVLVETDQERKTRNREATRAYQQAAKLLKRKQVQEGVQGLEALIKEYGDHYYSCAAQQLIATTWTTAKEFEKAIEAEQRFAERWPSHPDAPERLCQAATLLTSNVGDLPRAIEAYERVVELYPESPSAEQSLYQLGQLWMQSAEVIDYEKAMEAFLRLARDFPDSENADVSRKYAGDCQMQLRDPERARVMFMELMTEDPNSYAAYLAASRGYQWVRMRKDED